MRAENLHGILQKKLSSLIKIERIKGGSGNSNSIEIRRGLGRQRGEGGWHGQNIRRVVSSSRDGR